MILFFTSFYLNIKRKVSYVNIYKDKCVGPVFVGVARFQFLISYRGSSEQTLTNILQYVKPGLPIAVVDNGGI